MDKQITIVVDDFDQETPAETVAFEFENEPLEIDLAEHNQVDFKQAMDAYEAAVEGLLPFLKVARLAATEDPDPEPEDSGDLVNEFVPEVTEPETAKPRRRRNRKTNSASDSDVRRWALENGVTVNAKGRVPASVREQYVDAQ